MTDGAYRVIELWGNKEQKDIVQQHFLTRDPAKFWTSGQWVRYQHEMSPFLIE